MTRQGDVAAEERSRRRNEAVVRAVEFELVGSLDSAGYELHGFSLRYSEWECLLTMRASNGDGPQVCFIASDTIANTLIKAVRAVQRDKAVWKEDKYRAVGG